MLAETFELPTETIEKPIFFVEPPEDSYNSEPYDEKRDQLKKTEGQNWKRIFAEAVVESEDTTQSFMYWKTLEQESMGPEDFLVLAEIISSEEILTSPDRSIRSSVLNKFMEIPYQEIDTPAELINALEQAFMIQLPSVNTVSEEYSDFLSKTDMYSLCKVILIVDPSGTKNLSGMLDSLDNCPHLKQQVEELIALREEANFMELRNSYYKEDTSILQNGFEDTWDDDIWDEDWYLDEEPYHESYNSESSSVSSISPESEPESDENHILSETRRALGETYEKRKRLMVGHENLTLEEMDKLLNSLFREDIRFFFDAFEKEINLDVDDDGSKALRFRSLIIRDPNNKNSLPIMITRPDIEVPEDRPSYYNGNGTRIFHDDIFADWYREALDNPNSARAAIIRQIEQWGGYDAMTHLYMEIKRNQNGTLDAGIYSGFSRFFDENESELDLMKLIGKKYGVASISYRRSWHSEEYNISKLILQDMMSEQLEKNSRKLASVLSPHGVKQYKALARRYMMDPNANKSSPLYFRFLELSQLLEKI